MIVTPSISGAATAHSVSAPQPASSSVADLLLAGAPANSAADFRTIAASLFGLESSTAQPAQTPAKGAAAAKKPASDSSAEKSAAPKNKEISDPASTGAAVGLLVPLQSTPLRLPQISVTPDAADNGKLPSATNQQSIELDLVRSSEAVQVKNLAPSAGSTATKSADGVPSSSYNEDGTLSTQTSDVEHSLKTEKQMAAQTDLQIDNTPLSQNAASAKSAVAQSQPPIAVQTTKPSPVPGITTSQPHSTAPSLPVRPEKPAAPVTANVVPLAPPQPTAEAAAKAALDNSASIKSVTQSALVNSGTAGVSKSPFSRDASNVTSKIKDRDSKDSRLTSSQSSKPGFTPPVEVVVAPASSGPGNNKDFAGIPSSPHAGAQAKAVPLKDAGALPAAATLGDADAPDESLPPETASGIATAKLVQGMNQSEFRVGMQSQEFGSIDIRTSVVRHMFSAQISVEHGDMAKSLSAQLPGLYHRLADQQVTVGNIVIQGQNLGTSSGLAQDAQRQSSQPAPGSTSAKPEAETILPAVTDGIDPAGRLDIRI